jgi:hypothetical protein
LIRIVAALLLSAAALIAAPASSGPCDAPENSEFDFWLGSWDVSAHGRIVGHNDVARIQDGCTVTEDYRAVDGPYAGRSFNWWDPVASRWHQVWVDSGGTRLQLTGGLQDGSMVLAGERVRDGKLISDRITWTPNPDGTVRQHWEVSEDGGLSWGTLFDGLYTRSEP